MRLKSDVWINERTGERIEATTALRRVRSDNFEIVYISYLFDLFDKLGGKKYKVLKTIIENKTNDNIVIMTIDELTKKSGTSKATVINTLKMLRDCGLIKTRTGVIMLNAKLMVHGSKAKEAYIMQKFEAFDEEEQLNLW